jgi:hypothetical protein
MFLMPLVFLVVYILTSGPAIALLSERHSHSAYPQQQDFLESRICALTFAPLARAFKTLPQAFNSLWLGYVNAWMPEGTLVRNDTEFSWGVMVPGSPNRVVQMGILSYSSE